MARTQTQAIETEATVAGVFAVLSDPTQLPRWAPGFADEVQAEGERWRAVKDARAFAFRVVASPALGTIDFLREIAPGREGGAYLRVLPRPGGGAVVIMTLPVAPGSDPADVRKILGEELRALVGLLE